MMTDRELLVVVEDCRSGPELDGQIDLLHLLNQKLAPPMQIRMGLLMTNDVVGRALDLMEEKIMLGRNATQIQTGCV